MRPPRVARLRSKIPVRDLLETVVAVVLAPFFAWFGWMAWTHQKWPVAAFCALLVVSIVYIPWRLWRERRKLPKPDPDRPVKEYLLAERAAMQAQARLLESIWIWYLGPLGIGVVGFYVSMRGLVWQSWVYAGVVLIFYYAIGKANTVAARTQFREAVKELDEQLMRLENGGVETGVESRTAGDARTPQTPATTETNPRNSR